MQEEQKPSYNWPLLYMLVLAILLAQIGIYYWLTIRWE
ncbi:hypothetical protein BH09BAC1_BH09BAC1_23790 [soil metagenome]